MGRSAVSERGRSQGHGHGHGKDTGTSRAGQGTGDRKQGPQRGQGDKDAGAGKGPKGKGKGAVGPPEQTAWGMGAVGGGRSEGGGTGGGAPPQPDVQLVRCIPPGIRQMLANHTHHHHHHHAHLYNIDPDAGDSIPHQPPRPEHQRPPPPAPSAEPARMAAASAVVGRDTARSPRTKGPQRAPERGAEGAWPWDRDWQTVPDPLGAEAPPLVVEVYGWLSLASSGTTRGMRNQEVPPGGWAAPENQERILRTLIPAAWPDRALTWPAFLEGRAVLRNTDADANNWLPRALRNALTHWRYRRRNPRPPQPQPLAQATTALTAAPHRPRRWARGGGTGDSDAGFPPQTEPGPLTHTPPTTPQPANR